MNPYDPIDPPIQRNISEEQLLFGTSTGRGRLVSSTTTSTVVYRYMTTVAAADHHDRDPTTVGGRLGPLDVDEGDAHPSTRSTPHSTTANGVESVGIARRKLEDWGFDPDDVSKASIDWHSSPCVASSNIHYCARKSRPMIIFAQLGDLPMMRYILQNSTESTPLEELTNTDEHGLFPLYTAISKPHSEDQILAICQWLHANGADIQQQVGSEWSCLSRACLLGYDRVAKWLLTSGALLSQVDGTFDSNLAKLDIPPSCHYGHEGEVIRHVADRVHRSMFAWARNICDTRHSFMVFLSGTLVGTSSNNVAESDDPRQFIRDRLISAGNYSEQAVSFLLKDIPHSTLVQFLTMAVSPLNIFNGQSGVLELIGSFVGVEKNHKILCTTRGLVKHEQWWNRGEPLDG
jgi:hypothetical protein